MDMQPKYRRVLLKLSGEALAAGADGILNFDFTAQVAARRTAVVSVEKYGTPSPPPKMTTFPASIAAIASRAV